MKHLNRLKVLLLLVLLLFPLGCRKEEQEVGPTQLTPRNITVAEAKVWFEQILQKQPQARLNNTTYSNTEPQWKFAKEKRFSDGKTYVQVPLQFKEKMKRYGYVQREGKRQMNLKNV